jgi:hypothetical protein
MEKDEIILEELSPYSKLGNIVYRGVYPILALIVLLFCLFYIFPLLSNYSERKGVSQSSQFKYAIYFYIPLFCAAFLYFAYDIINTIKNKIILTNKSIKHETLLKTKTIKYQDIYNIEILQIVRHKNLLAEILNRIIGSNYQLIISDKHNLDIFIEDMSKKKAHVLSSKIRENQKLTL